MNIYINEQKIDFKLEKEQNLRDVLDAIRANLDEHDMYVTELELDGKKILISELEAYENKDLNEMTDIKLKAILKQELVSESAENIVKYLSNAIEYLKKTEEYKDEDIAKLQEGLNWCIEAFDKILYIYKLSSDYFLVSDKVQLSLVIAFLKDVKDNLYSLQLDNNFKNELLNYIVLFSEGIVKIISYVSLTVKSISPIDKTEYFVSILRDNNILINKMVDIIPDLAEKLQLGEEKDALNMLALFINFIAFYLNIMMMVLQSYEEEIKDAKKISEDIEDFANFFNQIKDSLEARDYVKLSDTIEYDFKTPLQKIIDDSKKLVEFLDVKSEQVDKSKK